MKTFEEKATTWANTRSEVRTVLVAGSRARAKRPGDEYADLDLELFVTDYNDYLSGGAWVSNFGKVWIKLPFQTDDGDPQFLVVYEGGYKVDFTFFPTNFLEQMVASQSLTDSQQRGYRILVDKDNTAARLPQPLSTPSYPKPSQENFYFNVNAFWYGAIYTAKQIRRGNLWVVKSADWRMKQQLFDMLEWHARATQGWTQTDTWYGGHFMKSWTDEKNYRALFGAFGHFHREDSWQALLGTMKLYRRLAKETAAQLGYNYPGGLDENVSSYIISLFEAEYDKRS